MLKKDEPYPEAMAAFEAAIELIPDDAPEIAAYADWSYRVRALLHMALQSAPQMDATDDDEQATRERMAFNLMIEALETISGSLPMPRVLAVRKALGKIQRDVMNGTPEPPSQLDLFFLDDQR